MNRHLRLVLGWRILIGNPIANKPNARRQYTGKNGSPRALARCNWSAMPRPNRKLKRLIDFLSKKKIVNAAAEMWTGVETRSTPKLYMLTKSTPNRAKPRRMSTISILSVGATGPSCVRASGVPAGAWPCAMSCISLDGAATSFFAHLLLKDAFAN